MENKIGWIVLDVTCRLYLTKALVFEPLGSTANPTVFSDAEIENIANRHSSLWTEQDCYPVYKRLAKFNATDNVTSYEGHPVAFWDIKLDVNERTYQNAKFRFLKGE